jgi:hypothetical protein
LRRTIRLSRCRPRSDFNELRTFISHFLQVRNGRAGPETWRNLKTWTGQSQSKQYNTMPLRNKPESGAKSYAVLPAIRQGARHMLKRYRKSSDEAGQHFLRTFTQLPCGQIGVNTAGYQAPSTPQRYTLQKPFAQFVEQSPGPPQVLAARILFLAASEGAIDIATATAAIAPTARNFVIDFIIVASSPVESINKPPKAIR